MEAAKFNRAIAMGLNETMARVNTVAKREIRARYNIENAAIDRKGLTQVKKASGRALAVALSVRNSNVPLIAFKGIQQGATQAQVKRTGTTLRKKVKGKWQAVGTPAGKKGDGGTKVEIVKGRSRRIPSAFLQAMKNGHIGVFGRGKYSKGKFNWRTGRNSDKRNDLPINELGTMTFHNQYVNKHIEPKLNKVAKENLMNSILRAINHQLNAA